MASLRLLMFGSLVAASVAMTAWFAPDLLSIDASASVRFSLVAVYALAILGGMLTVILPGGIGAREGAFVLMAQPWLTIDTALAVAAVLRLLNVAADLAVGLVGLAVFRNSNAKAP
jgi:hypothetical protein